MRTGLCPAQISRDQTASAGPLTLGYAVAGMSGMATGYLSHRALPGAAPAPIGEGRRGEYTICFPNL